MPATIAIRREDKNEWERRAPLTPDDLAHLRAEHAIAAIVQPSQIRVFPDTEYRAAGAEVAENIDAASIVLAIKEIPRELLQAGKTYVFFSHVIKGQPGNMPMLQRILDLGCSLVDYERIVDDDNRRLIFFGVHAGHAGMIETLWSLQRRLRLDGIETPLAAVRHAFEYSSLEEAKDSLVRIGELITRDGMASPIRPLVIGIAGYGNVSRGAQEVLDCLPVLQVAPGDLPAAARRHDGAAPLIKVVFREEDLVTRRDPATAFDLHEYYEHPERYRGTFESHLPYLDVLVNTIYWTERYPRLVTRDWAHRSYQDRVAPRLKVVGDISCDIGGSIELTTHTTQPDEPCFTYNPVTNSSQSGCTGPGLAIMAVDNLPCELPRESSVDFSRTLRTMIPALARANWAADFADLDLPPHLKQAVVVHRGRLTPEYAYLDAALDS